MFSARRLIESGDQDKQELGQDLLAAAIRRAVPKLRITHLLFAMTENAAGDMIDDDFADADGGRYQVIGHLRIHDHADFIEAAYDAAIEHADD